MKQAINGLLLAFVLVGLSSCQKDSDKLVPFEEPKSQNEKVDLGKEGLVTQLDVLFVVDDSGSMSTHQNNLANNIDLFTREFTKSSFVDYHVGVITSSMGSGFGMCGRVGCNGVLVGPPNWIERSTPNGIGVLQRNFVVGTDGSGSETFFDPVVAALTAPVMNNENKGFYRAKAHLAVIFVTDADDQSRMSSADFYNFLKGLKGAIDKVSVYAAYIPTADRNCDRGGETPPRKLEQLFSRVNAVTVGLCDPQFGKKLSEVGKDLFRRIARVMYLARVPDYTSIKVQYGNIFLPRDIKKGWTYDPTRNALLFGEEINWDSQPPGSNLNVEYTPAR